MYDAIIRTRPRRRRDRVHTARGERATPHDPPCGHERPADRAMRPDRSLGVVRARRVEATLAADPTRQREAIQADASDQREPGGRPRHPHDAAHTHHVTITCARESNSSTSATRSCAPGSDDRGPGDHDDVVSILDLVLDLSPRGPQDAPGSVAEHRATDPPAGDEGRRPGPGGDKHYHPLSVKCPAGREGPRDPTGVRRLPTRTGGSGPWRGAARGSTGPLESASERGNHAACGGGGCWVGRFASTSGVSRRRVE